MDCFLSSVGKMQLPNADNGTNNSSKQKPTTSIYVFNAFFMSMRNKFVGPNNSIHCYVVEWDPVVLSWKSFRSDLIGVTDPNVAKVGSLRNVILQKYKELGLSTKPNKGDNSIHASASPFEGFVEKLNWLQLKFTKGNRHGGDYDEIDDEFGNALLRYGGISKERILEWSKDPQILLSSSSGSCRWRTTSSVVGCASPCMMATLVLGSDGAARGATGSSLVCFKAAA